MKKKILKCSISYSHEDLPIRKRFNTHLNVISRTHPLDVWCDMKITLGEDINESIKNNFNKSDIIFLLVSPDFVDSANCFETELNMAIERHNKNECLIVPIIISEVVNLNALPFGSLERAPKNGRPVKSYRPYDRGFAEVAQQVIEMIDKFYKNGINNTPINTNKDSDKNVNKKVNKKTNNKTKKTNNIELTNNEQNCSSSVVKYRVVQEGELKEIAIPQGVISKLPDYHLSTVKFIQKMEDILNNCTNDYIESINRFSRRKAVADRQRLVKFRTFLFEIANSIADCYIGTFNTRVHFRRLIDNQYKGLVVSGGSNTATKASDLTIMPCNSGMIYISGRLGYPLIRSYNESHHMSGQNDNIWVEHLTCTFKDGPNAQGAPFLSMGISLNETTVRTYKNTLRIMAYTRLDITVGQYINRFLNKCNQEDKNFILSDIMVKSFK